MKYLEVGQISLQHVEFPLPPIRSNAPWRISARVINETTNSQPRTMAM
jgi:hypothetical protein